MHGMKIPAISEGSALLLRPGKNEISVVGFYIWNSVYPLLYQSHLNLKLLHLFQYLIIMSESWFLLFPVPVHPHSVKLFQQSYQN